VVEYLGKCINVGKNWYSDLNFIKKIPTYVHFSELLSSREEL
jgi:hypothetical protein